MNQHQNPIMPGAGSAVEILTLRRGASRCDVIPDIGGSIAAWSVAGDEIMRAADAASIAARDPFGMGSFPLVPYSNRIRNGSFEWEGKRHSLALNFHPEPHAIHGVGFDRPWRVCSLAEASLTLALEHRPGASWPFAFEAQQRITLGERDLIIDMSVANLESRPMPLAFGHHPYFPLEGAWLKFRAHGVWLVGDDGLPNLRVKPFAKFDYASGMPATRGDIDHCFTGWDGEAEIWWPERRLAVKIEASEALRCAVVCIRSDLGSLCFEPVPHLNDALNRSHGGQCMPVIAPGGSFSASVRLSVAAPRASDRISGPAEDRPIPGAPA